MSKLEQILRVSWVPVLSLQAWLLSLWEPLPSLFNVVMLLCILPMYHPIHTECPYSSPFHLKTLKATSSFTSSQFILRTRVGHREGMIPTVHEEHLSYHGPIWHTSKGCSVTPRRARSLNPGRNAVTPAWCCPLAKSALHQRLSVTSPSRAGAFNASSRLLPLCTVLMCAPDTGNITYTGIYIQVRSDIWRLLLKVLSVVFKTEWKSLWLQYSQS